MKGAGTSRSKYSINSIHTTHSYGDVKILEIINNSKVKVLFLNTGNEKVVNPYSITRNGGIRDNYSYKICGVGINDLENMSSTRYYIKWHDMLHRCYGEKTLAAHPTYRDCYVVEEWLLFSNFYYWIMEYEKILQKPLGEYHLDKDLLSDGGNKVYSPDTCLLLPAEVNALLTHDKHIKNKVSNMTGASRKRLRNKEYSNRYQASISNPFTKNYEFLGQFSTELEAHTAWINRKLEFIEYYEQSGNLTYDTRIYQALVSKYEGLLVKCGGT